MTTIKIITGEQPFGPGPLGEGAIILHVRDGGRPLRIPTVSPTGELLDIYWDLATRAWDPLPNNRPSAQLLASELKELQRSRSTS